MFRTEAARILADFQAAVKTFKVQLEDYMIVAKHLTTVYSYMLEHNSCRSVSLLIQQCSMVWGVSCNCIFLCRIIEHYSKVQVDYVAGKISLLKAEVEKLSKMILDMEVPGQPRSPGNTGLFGVSSLYSPSSISGVDDGAG